VRWIALGPLGLALAGCALSQSQPSHDALARADRLVEQGDYAAAVQAYDEALARHPDERDANRARTSRDTLTNLLAARADVARLQSTLTTREGELTREVTRLRQELQRVTQEADRLRADLEALKAIDLRQERPRR